MLETTRDHCPDATFVFTSTNKVYGDRPVVTGARYEVLGYGGKQVRDNIHCDDVAQAFAAFHANPRPGAVYNLGGGRRNSCSVVEGITLCEEIAGVALDWESSAHARVGDHRWWISDLSAFRADYPSWSPTYDLPEVLRQMHDANAERWSLVRS